MRVLVYGSTGSQMSPVAQELLYAGHEVRAFSRAVGDLADRDSVAEATSQVDAVALHIPFFGDSALFFTYAKNAIDAARDARVKMLVWNTSGTIPAQKTGNAAVDFRRDVLSYLETSGIPYAVFAPTMYAENLLGPWTTTYVKARSLVGYPAPADYRIGWLPTVDLARMIVFALSRPELSGAVFDVSGDKAYDGAQLARAFSEALGKDISYYLMPPKEFGAFIDEAAGREGAGAEAAAYYQMLWDNPDFRPLVHFDQTGVNERIATTRTDLVDWIRAHARSFR